MTGGIAHIVDEVGSQFSAWDGYIWGETVELVPGERIRQTGGLRTSLPMGDRASAFIGRQAETPGPPQNDDVKVVRNPR